MYLLQALTKQIMKNKVKIVQQHYTPIENIFFQKNIFLLKFWANIGIVQNNLISKTVFNKVTTYYTIV